MGILPPSGGNDEIEFCDHPLPAVNDVVTCLNKRGFSTRTGIWLVEGSPAIILFDLHSIRHRIIEWRHDLHKKAGIPFAGNDDETTNAVLFGYAVFNLAEEICKHFRTSIFHFHEWLSSVGLILCKSHNLPVATIFTTHATILGRYLCSGNVDFYNNLELFDVDYEAGRFAIYHRYCIERAAAHCAGVFTTVSHITAFEAKHLLKRDPGIPP